MGPDNKVGAGVVQPASIAAQQRMGVSPQRGLPAGAAAPAGTLRFGQALNQVRLAEPLTVALNQKEQAGPAALLPPSLVAASAPPSSRTVAAADTLSSIVKEQAQARGVHLTGSQIMRMVQQVASANKISNANRIFPGQHINLSSLTPEIEASRAGTVVAVAYQPTPAATALKSFQAASAPSAPQLVKNNTPVARHEVLDKTLNRAVSKGFIPANEKGDVRDKILELAKNHRFNPDDFARMTLMESDGMNPRASNQRCHGIIQFCDGSDRGAASAGYAANPKAILGLSVYQQLHLVDKYFDEVGLKGKGPAGLDDLYLSVLMPSARSETRSDAPLAVNGTQAKSLYEGRDINSPMTRQSILQGLLKNAADRLGLPDPTSGRLHAMRTAAYDDNAPQMDPASNPLR